MLYLKGVLDPLTHVFANLKIQNLTLFLNNQVIEDVQSSPVLMDDEFCWLDSLEKVDFQPIALFAPRTKGVKVPISTLVLGTNGAMGLKSENTNKDSLLVFSPVFLFLYLENCAEIQSNNGKFPSNYKTSPIDVETQISLRR